MNSEIMKKSVSLPRFGWGLDSRPQIHLANRFRLDDRGFRVVYNRRPSRNHALHLYDYSASMRAGGHRLSLQPGDVTLTPPQVQTSYDLPRPGYHLCVHFSPRRARGERIETAMHHHLGPDAQYVRGQLLRVTRLYVEGGDDPVRQLRAELVLHDLLLWLALHSTDKTSAIRGRRSAAAVRRVAELLEERIDQPLSVPELADEVGLAQGYLARCFRAMFGRTIQAHLLHRRMELAAHLLHTTSLSIGEVAQRVGYDDAQHFNKRFRAVFGRAPSRFRMS